MRSTLLLLLFFLCAACSKETKNSPIQGEHLFRNEKDTYFALAPPQKRVRERYSWEKKYLGKHPTITKEFFRCKGNPLNPVVVKKREGKEDLFFRDCAGSDHHGLPLRDGKEFVYPCLISLLNFIQEKTEKRVVITSGHRCPEHNSYCDSDPSNFGSKHMMAAECDFYVEGMEREGEKIVALIQEYYKGKGKELEKFERYEKTTLVTKPWYNKEIFIKLFQAHEGRDFDNAHSNPYICLQVRFDMEKAAKVTFDDKNVRNFQRY